MRIRPYLNKDFNVISRWITDERSHALWCASLIPYPLEKKGFDDLLHQAEERFGDSPFVATTDAVQLNVFPENPGAKKCYLKVGFRERALMETAFSYKDESWGRCNMIITR